MIKTRKELIKEYLEFFKKKKHEIIPSASLIPENDPTVLFTTAGMHPLVPFLLGEKHPLGKRLVNCQKCIRTGDIDNVGDDVHLTFFEMLGNWSLGDYWKKEAIEYSYEFLTKILKIPKEKLAVSCFAGDKDAGKDNEAAEIWKKLGIKEERIVFFGKENNWWGPAGLTGPCGPDTEMFYWNGKGKPSKLVTGDNVENWIEIWNDVFMQYNKNDKGNYEELKQKNVDTGMGVERTLSVLLGKDNVFETELFLPIINEIEKISGKKYLENKKAMRIIADHVKAATFILGDDKHLKPGNTEQGYVLRRLIRRAIRYARELDIEENFTAKLSIKVIEIYEEDYSELKRNRNFILTELDEEENRFKKVLEDGMKEFAKISNRLKKEKKDEVNGKEAFLLYQSYGFPVEMTKELAREEKLRVNEKEFEEEFNRHQELSRTASAGTFKSGLADNSEATTKLHTACHLLNQALREVLGKKDIFQRGSNITSERLRFDFNFDRKLTNEELKRVENWVNDRISEHLPVHREEMTVDEAKKKGAHGVFESKYGEKVFVYIIGNKSVEICSGPHVSNTSQLGHFKIVKEESSAAGVRRIKAVLE